MTTAKIVWADDWEALYIDGVKVHENHSVPLFEGLKAAGVDVEWLQAQTQADEDGCFPLLFEDVRPDD